MIKKKSILNFIIFGAFLMFVSCSSSKDVKSENKITCSENLAFKKQFFEHIQNVENLIYEVQGESLKSSLKFIGKYTDVSFERMSNYAGTYPAGIFESDKKVWLEWYEKNKCQNIEFKE